MKCVRRYQQLAQGTPLTAGGRCWRRPFTFYILQAGEQKSLRLFFSFPTTAITHAPESGSFPVLSVAKTFWPSRSLAPYQSPALKPWRGVRDTVPPNKKSPPVGGLFFVKRVVS